jgi:thymidine kinase
MMMYTSHVQPGFLEVITGGMYSGKTRRILEKIDPLVHRERILNLSYKTFLFFNPNINVRDPEIKSRYSSVKHSCISIDAHTPYQIIDSLAREEEKQGHTIDTIAVDEGQFFQKSIVRVTEKLLIMDKHVIIAGLNQDYRGEPFGSMGNLVLMANNVEILTAVCNVCGGVATRTQRLINGVPAQYDSPIIQVDTGHDEYQARCLKHHEIPGKPE